MSREVKKSTLVGLLADLVDVDPEEHTEDGPRCHYCLAPFGRAHRDGCAWVQAAVVLRGDPSIGRRLVGEEEEDFEDRLEEEEDERDGDELDRRVLAATARAELAELLGGPLPGEVPPDAADEVLADPLGEPTEFDPEA